MTEDEIIEHRVKKIGEMLLTMPGKIAGVCVDDDPQKPEKYIKKFAELYPTVRVIDQFKGPVKGVVTIRVTVDP